MPPVAVIDADVLFGATTRALFIYLDYARVAKVHWSRRILDELDIALVRQGRKATLADARANSARMNAALPDALLDQALVDARCPDLQGDVKDPNDYHVAACGVELLSGGYYPDTHSVALVTRNLADYNIDRLAAKHILVLGADEFLCGLPLEDVAGAFKTMRLDIQGPPQIERVLGRLAKDGQVRIADALRLGLEAGQLDL